jgi:hypothetical protein
MSGFDYFRLSLTNVLNTLAEKLTRTIKYDRENSDLSCNCTKGDVTRNDFQRRFAMQMNLH